MLMFMWGSLKSIPTTPDCNPMDYFVWGVLEAKVNATRHNTKEELRLAIKVAIEGLNKGSVANDGSKFRARLKKVIGAEGDHLE